MDRRRFLTLLGLAPVAASTKAYSFLGGILRPRPTLEVDDWRGIVRIANIDSSLLVADTCNLFDLMIAAHKNAMENKVPGFWVFPAIDRMGNHIT